MNNKWDDFANWCIVFMFVAILVCVIKYWLNK